MEDSLERYRDKRDFDHSPEPAGKPAPDAGREPVFVIQKHAASHLHYDFRLEINGVSKSWAVPKGPSTNPADKRLAMPTEDHPLGYAAFEGVIPKGEYGAGQVIVWDIGTYQNVTESKRQPVTIEAAAEKGHISVILSGQKLTGGYALKRFKTGKDEAWLLIKTADQYADPERNPVRDEPRSVVSGKTIEDLKAEA